MQEELLNMSGDKLINKLNSEKTTKNDQEYKKKKRILLSIFDNHFGTHLNDQVFKFRLSHTCVVVCQPDFYYLQFQSLIPRIRNRLKTNVISNR